MKKGILLIVLFLAVQVLNACPLCEQKQPKILRGIAHGAGPESQWDYAIVWVTVIITVVSFVYAIKYLFKPGETETDHIKRAFLTFE